MRFVAVFLSFSLLTALPAAASPSTVQIQTSSTSAPVLTPITGQTKLVVAGTEVPIHVIGSLSSNSAKVADTFSFTAAHDVVVEGRVVIKKGAEGQGEVASVQKAGGNGHSGSLGLKFDWIYAADGGKVELSDTPQASAEEDRKGASSTATIVGLATFGIGGLFGHNFAHGRDMTIDDTKTLSVFIASNVHVVTTEDAGNGYDH